MTPTDALRAARACILTDRTSLADCCTDSAGNMEPDDQAALAEYDSVLAQIDEALRECAAQQSFANVRGFQDLLAVTRERDELRYRVAHLRRTIGERERLIALLQAECAALRSQVEA